MRRIANQRAFWVLTTLAGLVLIFCLVALVSVRFVGGQWLGPRSLARTIVNTVLAVSQRSAVSSADHSQYTNIIFLHHSTGNNLIEQGGVRERLTKAGYSFWDHGYNYQGLRDPAGKYADYSYSVPNDNTDPDGLARIFAQQAFGLPVNTLSALLQHDVIIIKSCFAPANHITTDQQLEDYKTWYRAMRATMDKHPDKLLIVVTDPPLNPTETNPQEGARARAFANWLISDDFLKGHPNTYSFDLFGLLAQENAFAADVNMLRSQYRDGSDSHPNHVANETLGPQFADYILRAIQDRRAKSMSGLE
jgi:hypothetical protein